MTVLEIDAQLWHGRAEHGSALVGGKALGLGSLHAAGLAAPPAFVVTTTVYDAHVTPLLAERPELAAARRLVAGTDLDPEPAARITQAAHTLPGPLAVRSSAVVEDSASASWAGQFDSILGVPAEAVQRSVIQCWASIFGEAPARYAQRQGIDVYTVSMAVVIQQLVNPVWAGVAFAGADEAGSHSDGVMLVEAVGGMGERLVSGAASPDVRATFSLTDRRLLNRDEDTGRRVGRPLPDAVVEQLADGADRLAHLYGTVRLDLEWAWDGHTLWFLQVRPLAF